jgi:hypothetical protein
MVLCAALRFGEEVCFPGQERVAGLGIGDLHVGPLRKDNQNYCSAHRHNRAEKAEASLGANEVATSPEGRPEREIAHLCKRLGTPLQHASLALRPDNLLRMSRPEIQEFLLVLEEMKMAMSELEVLRPCQK